MTSPKLPFQIRPLDAKGADASRLKKVENITSIDYIIVYARREVTKES